METEHPDKVVDSYKQHKINLSILARIRALISSFEAGDAMDRGIAKIGFVIVVVLILVAIYYFTSSSQIVIS